MFFLRTKETETFEFKHRLKTMRRQSPIENHNREYRPPLSLPLSFIHLTLNQGQDLLYSSNWSSCSHIVPVWTTSCLSKCHAFFRRELNVSPPSPGSHMSYTNIAFLDYLLHSPFWYIIFNLYRWQNLGRFRGHAKEFTFKVLKKLKTTMSLNQCCPIKLPMTLEMFRTVYRWLPNAWNVVSASEELKPWFYLTLINVILNSPMWLGETTVGSRLLD